MNDFLWKNHLVEERLEDPLQLNMRDKSGKTALIHASVVGEGLLVHQLLTKQVDMEARDKGDWTALMYACFLGRIEIVKQLTEAGANVKRYGLLPIAAMSKKFRQLGPYLVLQGVDIEEKGEGGQTALEVSAIEGQQEDVQYLLDLGADINAIFENRKYETCLDKNEILRQYIEQNVHVLTTQSLKKWKSYRLRAIFSSSKE